LIDGLIETVLDMTGKRAFKRIPSAERITTPIIDQGLTGTPYTSNSPGYGATGGAPGVGSPE